MTPRIPPLEPPYAPEMSALLQKWMPPGSDAEPLRLFRTLCVHPELSSRMRSLGSGVLGHGLVEAREREIVIDRTCARAGAEYEWGVHAVAFGEAVGLSEAQIAATVSGEASAPVWSDRDRLLVRLADELHDSARVSDELWSALASHWTPPQLLELLVIAGWYRLLAYVINGARVECEDWAPRFPKAADAR
jgi:4-carboxymuconolactone decarboxylase